MLPRPTLRWVTGAAAATGLSLTAASYGSSEVSDRMESVVRAGRTAMYSAAIATDYKMWMWRADFNGWTKKDSEWTESRALVDERSAQRLLHVCRANGGVYTKWGQYIASLNNVLPQVYIDELSVLQDRVPPRPWSEVKQRLEAELGGPLSQFYKHVDQSPIASASLAQVHRGVTLDGQEVAIKVQYPKLDRQVEGDIWTMRLFASLVGRVFPSFEFSWVLPEFETNIRRELDFTKEAANANKISEMLQHRPDLYIPRTLDELTTTRVLTMEFIHGVKVSDVDGIKGLDIEPLSIADAVASAFGEMTFCHGFIHCDPHPGNMLVRRRAEDGLPQLVILDHGMYRQLDPAFRSAYCRLWQSLIMRDDDLLHQSAKELGIGEYAELLPYMFSFRSAAAKSKLGNGVTKPNAKVLGRKYSMSDLNNLLESLPRDMLFVLRTLNLSRSVNLLLGGDSRQRFRINATCAMKGLSIEDPAAAAKMEAEQDAAEPVSRRKRWMNQLKLKATLAQLQFRVWFIDLVFSWIWWWNAARS